MRTKQYGFFIGTNIVS